MNQHLYRLKVYLEMYLRQLRDSNALAPLTLFQRMRRGHRIGTMSMMVIKGPPYRVPLWLRWRVSIVTSRDTNTMKEQPMTPEIEDALYTACAVTTHTAKTGQMRIADHKRAAGTFHNPPSSVREFRAKALAFLGELDATLTVGELLDELRE